MINEKIRGAAFVPFENENKETFKYNRNYNILKYLKKNLLGFKRIVNSFLQKIKLELTFIDWKKAKSLSLIWITEAAIEGLLINFAVHSLFGWRLNPWTILSYGILIKESIDISRRLRSGTNTKFIKEKE